jgi:hypothetical protein
MTIDEARNRCEPQQLAMPNVAGVSIGDQDGRPVTEVLVQAEDTECLDTGRTPGRGLYELLRAPFPLVGPDAATRQIVAADENYLQHVKSIRPYGARRLRVLSGKCSRPLLGPRQRCDHAGPEPREEKPWEQ